MKRSDLVSVVVTALLILILVVVLDPGRDPGLLILLFGSLLLILGIPKTAMRVPGLSGGDKPKG
jgi:hypothetical protein